MKGSYDFSTLDGRKSAHDAIARCNLPGALKAALIGALDAGRFPPLAKGRPPGPQWKRQKNSLRYLSLIHAQRGQKTAEIEKWAKADKLSPKTVFDNVFRPDRNRKKR